MVITHEPTFYNHLDDKERFGQDPVLKAKLKFIDLSEPVQDARDTLGNAPHHFRDDTITFIQA